MAGLAFCCLELGVQDATFFTVTSFFAVVDVVEANLLLASPRGSVVVVVVVVVAAAVAAGAALLAVRRTAVVVVVVAAAAISTLPPRFRPIGDVELLPLAVRLEPDRIDFGCVKRVVEGRGEAGCF